MTRVVGNAAQGLGQGLQRQMHFGTGRDQRHLAHRLGLEQAIGAARGAVLGIGFPLAVGLWFGLGGAPASVLVLVVGCPVGAALGSAVGFVVGMFAGRTAIGRGFGAGRAPRGP